MGAEGVDQEAQQLDQDELGRKLDQWDRGYCPMVRAPGALEARCKICGKTPRQRKKEGCVVLDRNTERTIERRKAKGSEAREESQGRDRMEEGGRTRNSVFRGW